jgi:ATP-binding cassette subfamily B protein
LNHNTCIDTIIYQSSKENGVEMSREEAQKLAISRALYKDTPIVILDEPTASLDPQSEAEVYEKFSELVQNKTSLFISHRMNSCNFCDDVIVVDKGEIIERGHHNELIRNQGLYSKMWTKTGTDCGICIQSCPFTQGVDLAKKRN